MHPISILQDGCNQFHSQMGGRNDGFVATGVMEIVYEEDSFTLEPDAGWELQND